MLGDNAADSAYMFNSSVGANVLNNSVKGTEGGFGNKVDMLLALL